MQDMQMRKKNDDTAISHRRFPALSLMLSFAKSPRHRRSLACQALIDLVRSWFLVRFRPFSSYSSALGVVSSGDPEWETVGNLRIFADVQWAVWRWNSLLGGRFTCLMQAMAGQALLARLGMESAVVLGVKPGRTHSDPMAHAWLRVGPWIILGHEERAGHIAVASYRTSSEKVRSNDSLSTE